MSKFDTRRRAQWAQDWQAKVKGLLKAELKRRNLTYQELAGRLEEIGVHETPRNIANKISRGGVHGGVFRPELRSDWLQDAENQRRVASLDERL